MVKLDDDLNGGDPRLPMLLARQAQTYFENVPVAVGGHIFNALVIVTFAWSAAPHAVLLIWAALVVGLSGSQLRSWDRHRRHPERCDPQATFRAAEICALAMGAAWGVAVAWLLVMLPPPGQLVVPAILTAGMMNAGASTFAPIPRAAIAFSGMVALGAAAGFVSLQSIVGYIALALLASYCVLLFRLGAVSFRQFAARAMRKYEAEEQAETVKLLLHDFEDEGADWLWVVDGQGRLEQLSQRFAEAVRRPSESLKKTALTDLFDEYPEKELLGDHILAMRAFSNLILPMTIAGEQRWWSLSARPRLGADRATPAALRGLATEVTAAKRSEAKLAYMAYYDALTDLPNRLLFQETLERALSRRLAGHHVAVLCLDLDQFKTVNDTLGHPVGDQLLQSVARRLKHCIDDHDLVARLGGDEFAVILANATSRAEVGALASRIIHALAETVDLGGHRVLTSASIGIALSPNDGDTPTDLLKNADLALYAAKAGGRNRYGFFETGMDEAARHRRQIEMDLRVALSRGQLELHYQPLINIESGQVSSYEALMRWRHPERGAVPPTEFIAIAEETGLIVQLGEWVIHQAVAEMARWPEHVHVAVNLSPSQMHSASLVSTIVNALAAARAPSHRLELEITESVLMQDSEANLATLRRLRSLGVRIALDDFGTGYSSLNYLRSFPFDKIKIDRCFIEAIDTSEDCRAIVSSITGLAKRLGMITTAEGVERPEQLAALSLQGCTEAQGFLFSKAVSADELTDLRRKAPIYPLQGAVLMFPIAPSAAAEERQRRHA
jgi:diguanylate cyclase (GGDEF)-like protein